MREPATPEFDAIVNAEFTAGQEMAIEYEMTAELHASWWLDFYYSDDRQALPAEPSITLPPLPRRTGWGTEPSQWNTPWPAGADGAPMPWHGLQRPEEPFYPMQRPEEPFYPNLGEDEL